MIIPFPGFSLKEPQENHLVTSEAIVETMHTKENNNPVSYTHLDVYKRQSFSSFFSSEDAFSSLPASLFTEVVRI